MKKQTRRKFVATTVALGTTAMASGLPHSMKTSHKLVHHVFFWLKNPDSQDDLEQLIKGLKTLAKIKSVKGVHLGIPASTEKRDVVDNSFSASEILYFDDVAGQDAYQTDPIHQKFVEENSHLWDKVIVYDAIAIP